MTFLPTAFSKASMTSKGKPSGYVGMGLSEIIPLISQCPVVVSFPRLSSRRRAIVAQGFLTDVTEETPSIFPKPSVVKFGIFSFPVAAMLLSVFAPTSPKSQASGASPIPKESSTIRNILLHISFPLLRIMRFRCTMIPLPWHITMRLWISFRIILLPFWARQRFCE